LGAFLGRRILKPLGMSHSAFEPVEGEGTAGRARGYTTFALGPPEPAPREADGWIHAAGGLWASAPDLARWDIALMEGKVLSPESYRRMTTPRVLAGGATKDYGYGLSIVHMQGETVLSHNGAVSGFQASNAMVPRTRSALVLLTNGEHVSPGPLYTTLLTLLLRDREQGGASPVPEVSGPPPKEAALDFFHQMQAGQLDRGKLGEEFSAYLDEARVRDAAPRLKALGEPESVVATVLDERGGMEVTSIRFTFKDSVIRGSMYRSPDGKIQQLLFSK
jgi:CubicO group peptidase (beta-lactamase class C family)